ncbi:MAG: hypothetical protein QOE76_1825 [Frankiales bacterium]|nr:hypothetical protein [Frankiales bacterium]
MTLPSVDPTACGERIEVLLEASAAAGPVARERAEELIRIVVELYGAGLERLMELAFEAGKLDDDLLERLAGDQLVSSLLLVHGLHPYGIEERVERALAGVRPYLDSHGGDVRLLDVTDEGVVRLQLLGSCDGCASSSATLELAVDGAVRAAAPEVIRIDVEAAPSARGLIPVADLTARLRPAEATGAVIWSAAGRSEDLAVGALQCTTIAGLDVLICRLLSGVYAYRDSCARCGAGFTGSVPQRSPSSPGSAVLTCPACSAHYDIRKAGVEVEDPALHLEPVPLLERDGGLEIAVRAPVPA